MTEELKPVRTEGFARECREIADGLKVEYGQRRNRNGMPYLDFERHPYVGRAGALLRQATAIVAELEALRATPAPAQPEREAWQPIETAPRDATEILTYTDERTIMVLYWRNPSGRWSDGVSDETWGPTHWMPLPAAPKEKP